MIDLSGQILGHYHIERKVAEGGMATIYFAQDTRYDRPVAIKVLLSNLRDPEFFERFSREAKNAATLQHPHILSVYDSGTLPDVELPYIVMAWAGGGSLTQLLEQAGGSLSLAQTGDILREIASALDFAHQHGTVHRDIKPSNVMLTEDGHVMLGDFGIAKTLQDTELTTSGSQLGTPTYMPPEQIKDGEIGPWSDIYALGVLLFRLLTGHPPFEGSMPNVLLQHISDNPPPLKTYKKNLPKALDKVIAQAMAKVPAKRYYSAGEMVADFQLASGVSSASNTLIFKPQKKSSTMKWLTIVGVIALLLAIVGGIFFFNPNLLSGMPNFVSANGYEQNTPTPTKIATFTATPLLVSALNNDKQTNNNPLIPVEPEDRQVFSVGSNVLLRWSGQAPAKNERFSIFVKDTAGNTYAEHSDYLAYLLSDMAPDEYTWIIILEQKDSDGNWNEISRSEARHFVVMSLSGVIPIATNRPIETKPPATPTVVPTTPAPTATSKPAQPTVTPTMTPTPMPILNGKLAFSIRQGSIYKTYVVEMTDAFSGVPYASIGDARDPSLSYDGQWLLADGTGGTIGAIARYKSDGSQPAAVTCQSSTADSRRPTWSPDGKYLAFDGLDADPARHQIYIQRSNYEECNLAGIALRVSGGDTFENSGMFPIWGPDNRIYFRGCETWALNAGNCGIWSVQPNGGDIRQIVDGANIFPTGVGDDYLLYMTAESGDWEVYKVNLTTGSRRNFTNKHSASDVWGTVAPDGKTIAFLSDRNGYWALWLANANGENLSEWMPINPDWGAVETSQLMQGRMTWQQ